MKAGHALQPLLSTTFNEKHATLSPDGRWLAYVSDASGAFEVYVRPFPNVSDGLLQVSTRGGVMPRWSPRGGQLFYVALDRMMAVAVETVPRLSARGAQVLFEKPYFGWSDQEGHPYDVAPDGKRFLVVKLAVGDSREYAELRLVLNWSEELKAKVAAR